MVFASVWHDQLGHVRLQRITAPEREERKRLDKKDKKDKDDEEERNRLSYHFVKYTLGKYFLILLIYFLKLINIFAYIRFKASNLETKRRRISSTWSMGLALAFNFS